MRSGVERDFPEYSSITSVSSWNAHNQDYMKDIWEFFLKKHFPYVQEKDMRQDSDLNYYIYNFKQEYQKFHDTILSQEVGALNELVSKYPLFEGKIIEIRDDITASTLYHEAWEKTYMQDEKERIASQILKDWENFLEESPRADWNETFVEMFNSNHPASKKWQEHVVYATGVEYKKEGLQWVPTGKARSLEGMQKIAEENGSSFTLQDEVTIKDTLRYKIHFEKSSDFFIRSKNVFIWIFKIMQQTLHRFEDLIMSRSEGIMIPQKAIEEAIDESRAEKYKFKIPEGAPHPERLPYFPGKTIDTLTQVVEDMANEGPKDWNISTWDAQHHNAGVKAYRDNINTYRQLSQKKLGAATSTGSALNTAISNQANMLKAIATMNAELIRSIIRGL